MPTAQAQNKNKRGVHTHAAVANAARHTHAK